MHLLTNVFVTLIAYLLDKRFGEYHFITHPVILIGRLITKVEEVLYRDSILFGGMSVVLVVGIAGGVSYSVESFLEQLPLFLYVVVTGFLASMFIAHTMLKSAVLEVANAMEIEAKREAVSMLVSRDTESLSESEVYKAAIETYAENLSDGVVAPMFYLLLFSLPGIVVYKTINTLDSMMGYRNERYERYGKIAARLDDIANFIPARITALLIAFLCKKGFSLEFLTTASLHESPNAGYPIAAMGYCLGVKLGGDTYYFKKLKKKPTFGRGREPQREDVVRSTEVL